MKPAEYAQELGISRQAVYAKIKRGILKSKNVEGKLYIVVDTEIENKESSAKVNSSVTRKSEPASSPIKDYKALLQAKDETIAVLKETVVDLKESNKQISTTLRGEIDLLKDAFHEMRTLYVRQLEHKQTEVLPDEVEEALKAEEEAIEIFSHEEEELEIFNEETPQWIGLKKFFKRHGITKEKQQEKIMKRFKKAYKKGDERVIKQEEKLKINANKNYEDILH